MMKKQLLTLFLIMISAGAIFAGEESGKNTGKIHGYMFGDYYYVSSNHDSGLVDQNGFWLRRVYLGYDKDLDGNFSMRLRLEMNTAGDFSSSFRLEPYIKDAYLKWKKSGNTIYAGISPSPTWGVIEHFWGYRSVERTPLDLQKWGSSRDFGIALKGKTPNGVVGYHLMLGNGNSNRSETNPGKKAMGAVSVHPTGALVLEGYLDWNDNPGGTDWITVQGFAGFKTDQAKIGLQYAQQTRKVENGKDIDLSLVSAFLVATINPKTNIFARVDRQFDPNPRGNSISYIPFDETAKSTFFVGGLDFSTAKNVHIMPNVEMVKYDENDAGVTPDTDVIARVTTFFKF